MNSKWSTLIFPNLTPSAGKKWNGAGEKKKEKECGREGETTQDIAWLVHNLTRKGVNWNWTASLQMRLGSEIMNDFVWARLLTFRHVNDWYSKDMLHLIAGTPNDFIMWRCVCVRATYYLNNFVRKMYSGDLFSFGGGETTKDFYPASDLLQSSSWFVIPHFPPTTSIKVVRAGAIKIGSRVEMDCE